MFPAILVIIILLTLLITVFNKLIRYKYLVREAWAGIDVQLKRRHDLLPKILETAKGYAQYEASVMKNVTALRSGLSLAAGIKEKSKLENSISQALKGFFALAEAYPDLKADQSFLELQKMISAVEDEIQMSRRYYNGTVRDYNVYIQSFPGMLLARLLGFTEADFFEIEYATERQSPDMDFSPKG